MDDFKIDYVERIKSLLEKEDEPALTKYIAKISKNIENDEEFNDLITEINKKNFPMALAITEEIIYEHNTETFSYGYDEDDDEDEAGFSGDVGYTETNEEESYY